MWAHAETLAPGEGWYVTAYDSIAGANGAAGPPLPQARRLLIAFPAAVFAVQGIEPLKRHYQDEQAIHQTTARHFELGDTAGFITVLIPHPAGADPEALAASVRAEEVAPVNDGLAVRLERGGKTWVVFGAYDSAFHFLDAATGLERHVSSNS